MKSVEGILQEIRRGLAEHSELSQSRARILINVLAFIYLTVYYRNFGEPGDHSWYAAILVSIYLAGAIVWHGLIRLFPRPNRLRKAVAIASDAAIVSAGVHLGGAHGVVLYPVYFWIIAGNGLRFGTPYLRMAMVMSTLGLTAAVLSSSYWLVHVEVGIGLLVGLLAISALFYSMAHRLEETSRRLRERVHESERLATHDHLTGLPNRALFLARLEQELGALPRNRSTLAVLFIDLDGFKAINDDHGHASGDWLLTEVGERLRHAVRRSDTAARIGGDEFAILLTHLHGRGEARAVAEALLQALACEYRLGGRGTVLSVTPSIGLAVAPDDGEDAESLFHFADMAMYAVKRSSKCAVGDYGEIAGGVRAYRQTAS